MSVLGPFEATKPALAEPKKLCPPDALNELFIDPIELVPLEGIKLELVCPPIAALPELLVLGGDSP